MQTTEVVVGGKYRIIKTDKCFESYIGATGSCTSIGKTGMFQIGLPSGGSLYFTADQLEAAK